MVGLIGKKKGMTQVFDDDGNLIPATVIAIEPNVVTGQRDGTKHGYSAVILGALDAKAARATKPEIGQFKKGVKLKRHIIEFRDFGRNCAVGDLLGPELFEGIRFVDVIGTSKGKGYQGVVKRHNFGGGRATHGSKFHRSPGSTGMAAWPSKVFKGTKMPGRMGAERSTVQNLRVVRIDQERGVLLVRGAIPGRRGGMVIVCRAKKRK